MTPNWRSIVKPLLNDRSPSARGSLALLAKAKCFDLSGVQALVNETATQMSLSASEGRTSAGEPMFDLDIGQTAFLPSPVVWLEWASTGVLITSIEPDTGAKLPDGEAIVVVWMQYTDGQTGLPIQEWETHLAGGCRLSGGLARCVRWKDPNDPWTRDDLPEGDPGRQFLFKSLAGVSLINSPNAGSEHVFAHTGLSRNVKGACGIEPTTKATRIVLRFGSAKDGAVFRGVIQGTSTPKAYHFCRAHLRHVGEKVSHVRAHWRGDPAFGIRIGGYQAVQGRSGQIDCGGGR